LRVPHHGQRLRCPDWATVDLNNLKGNTMAAETLIIETPRKRVTIRLARPMDIHEIRDHCRKLVHGFAPQTISLSGPLAIATYLGTKIT